MKVTKFLPLALSLMLIAPASFATATNSQTSTYTLELPEFINITKTDGTITTGATFDDTYETITLGDNLSTTFTVITNKNGKNIALKATCPLAEGSAPAIGGTGAAPKLAFANTTTTSKPTAAQVSNALGAAAIASNPNVIAFALTPTITPDTASGATDPTIGSITNGAIPYTLHNGKYTMLYQVATAAVAGTFSTHDEMGTYSCTIVMSDATP